MTAKHKVMSVAEIERLFPDEWVVIEITRHAKRHESNRGRLVAHGSDPDALAEQDVEFRATHRGAVTYMFHTTRTVPDGVVVVL